MAPLERLRLRTGESRAARLKEDGDSFVQFGLTVVVGEDGCEGAKAGEVFRRQAMKTQAEEGLIFVGVDDELLQLVEDVSVEVAVVGAVDVQGVWGANPASINRDRICSSGRSVPSGRRPRGVDRGRVSRSGTTLGWRSARSRRSWAMRRSCACQSGSSGKMASSLRTSSETPSSMPRGFPRSGTGP